MAVDISASTASMSMTAYAPSVDVPVVNDFQKLVYRDDLENVFFNTNDFADGFKYYHSSLGRWETYVEIFDDPHASVNISDTEFNSLRPQMQIPEYQLKHRILKNDRVKRRGKVYIVDEFISDGVGVTTVYLRLK